jgi:PAS domain S-box-containing protein
MHKIRSIFSLDRAAKHTRDLCNHAYKLLTQRHAPERQSSMPSLPTHTTSTSSNQHKERRRHPEAQFFDLANSLPVMIWLWECNYNCSWISTYWTEYTGLSATQSLGSAWLIAMHPEDRPGFEQAMTVGMTNRHGMRIEFRIKRNDGNYRWIALRAEPRYNKENVFEGLTGSGTDITELYESRIEAERLTQTRTALLSTVSHEIRTPMNGIVGLTTLALNQTISEEVRDQLTGIASSSRVLVNILNDILDFAKIDSNKLMLDITTIDLRKLINAIRDLFQPPAFMAGITLSTRLSPNVPLFVNVDEKRLLQTLSNLMSNAIKFTPKGAVHVDIDFLGLVQSQVYLRFSVIDTGIGLNKQALGDLIQPFIQADSSISRKYGGAGLGLSISQGILRTMGSQLQLESQLGHGSTFYFDLELSVAEKQTDTSIFYQSNKNHPVVSLENTHHDMRLSGKHVLLAEDNRINQQVAQSFLKRAGAIVTLANNGIEALTLLKAKHVDVILMDVQMPVMDGLEAAQNIRELLEYADIPIIGLSAGISAQERTDCMNSGMNDFLPKPIHPEHLVQTIERWTHSRQESKPALHPAQPIAFDAKLTKEQQTEVSPYQSLIGFDIGNVVSMLGDEELVHHLLLMFLEDTQHLKEDLQTALDQNNFVGAHNMVHFLIGSAGILGATQLRYAAEQFDVELKQSILTPLTYQVFQRVLKETRHALTQFTQQALKPELNDQAQSTVQSQTTDIAGKHILVVDDNRFVQQAMQSLLSTAGAHVLIASNGQHALEMLDMHDFDAVLMDLQMPVMDGLEATRQIRAQPRHKQLAIVGLSAKAAEKEQKFCIENGMNQLIAKTSTPERIIQLLSEQIDRQCQLGSER